MYLIFFCFLITSVERWYGMYGNNDYVSFNKFKMSATHNFFTNCFGIIKSWTTIFLLIFYFSSSSLTREKNILFQFKKQQKTPVWQFQGDHKCSQITWFCIRLVYDMILCKYSVVVSVLMFVNSQVKWIYMYLLMLDMKTLKY